MMTTGSLVGAALVGSLMSVLVGCVPAEQDTDAGLDADLLAATSGDGEVPKGAIQLSETSYAVPVSVDGDGCEQFSEWSTAGAARQIVYFHDGNGGFTATKSVEHACNADMVAVGEDDRGCTLYRAEQPDGSATDIDYYPSGGGFTWNPDTADCAG